MVNSLSGRHVAAAMVEEMERASVPRHRIGMREVNSNGIAARPSKRQQFRQGQNPVLGFLNAISVDAPAGSDPAP
jgi:hypothetical protein